MAKLQHKTAAEAQAAELKATAVLEANEAAQAAAEAQAATRRFRDGSIRRCSVADLDTPVAGEEIENGAEVPQKKDLMRQETSYNQEMRSLIQTQ
jgi:hypothetical protein